MAFNSLLYLAFLAVAVPLFWMLPVRLRRAFVLLVSLAFYASWGIALVWLPLIVAVAVYVAGSRMAADRDRVKRWMHLAIAALLALLVAFKYRSFAIDNLNVLVGALGLHKLPAAAAIILPLGLSFYTFEAIGYLIDVRQGRVKTPGFIDLYLFFMFWPNILSGPIVRARELAPQLNFRKEFEPRFVFEGLDRVIWGLIQKNVIANTLGVWVDQGFAPPVLTNPSTLDSWFLAFAFALQIYFDFAAYSNIAIGVARLLGVTLPENFRYPYHAATPPEFWARWHMTLSRWVRDYLFFPINARWLGAPVPLYLSLIGVMALVGLWHGAGWGFVVWGLLHGTYLVAYRMYESRKAGSPSTGGSRASSVVWRVLTLIAVTAAWVPFRATTLAKASSILFAMFYHFRAGTTYGPMFYSYTVTVALFCAVEPWVARKLNELEDQATAESPSPFRIVAKPLAYLCGLLLFLLFEVHDTQFIYSQF